MTNSVSRVFMFPSALLHSLSLSLIFMVPIYAYPGQRSFLVLFQNICTCIHIFAGYMLYIQYIPKTRQTYTHIHICNHSCFAHYMVHNVSKFHSGYHSWISPVVGYLFTVGLKPFQCLLYLPKDVLIYYLV